MKKDIFTKNLSNNKVVAKRIQEKGLEYKPFSLYIPIYC